MRSPKTAPTCVSSRCQVLLKIWTTDSNLHMGNVPQVYFMSIVCNSEHIFPQKQWQAALERPILPMMYFNCSSVQKSLAEPQEKKKKSVGVFRIPTCGG